MFTLVLRSIQDGWTGTRFNAVPEVRTHPRFGVYVPGLTESAVTSTQELMELVRFGNSIRIVGSTNMNAVSSRYARSFGVTRNLSFRRLK